MASIFCSRRHSPPRSCACIRIYLSTTYIYIVFEDIYVYNRTRSYEVHTGELPSRGKLYVQPRDVFSKIDIKPRPSIRQVGGSEAEFVFLDCGSAHARIGRGYAIDRQTKATNKMRHYILTAKMSTHMHRSWVKGRRKQTKTTRQQHTAVKKVTKRSKKSRLHVIWVRVCFQQIHIVWVQISLGLICSSSSEYKQLNEKSALLIGVDDRHHASNLQTKCRTPRWLEKQGTTFYIKIFEESCNYLFSGWFGNAIWPKQLNKLTSVSI